MSFRKPYQASRAGGGYVKGIWTPGTPTPFTVHASIRPVTGEKVVYDVNGRSVLGTYTMYTSDDVLLGDLVSYYGKNLEVLDVQVYDVLLQHKKVALGDVNNATT